MLQSVTLQQVGVSGVLRRHTLTVIPAEGRPAKYYFAGTLEAGIQTRCRLDLHELSRLGIPACAGMTR